MLKDFKIDYLGNNQYKITIIDSDFTSTVITPSSLFEGVGTIKIAREIIHIYSSKNLNVAYNLFLFICMVSTNDYFTVEREIEEYKKYIPEYLKYHSEIEKYLLLK
jgi:hypothetical protein